MNVCLSVCVSFCVQDNFRQTSGGGIKSHVATALLIPLPYKCFQGYTGISLSVCPSVYKILIFVKGVLRHI